MTSQDEVAVANPSFDDLPFSYRLSQRAMAAAAVIAIFGGRAIAAPRRPAAVRWGLAAVIGACALFSLITSCYVVIRYPYLSLVQTADGDIFSKQFTSKTVARLTKAVGLTAITIVLMALIGIALNKGVTDWVHGIALWYVSTLFLFVVYLCFFHDPELHPTVATFVRSTLGLGILLFPVLFPVLMIGSLRCKQLLESQETG
ncbi:MAG: hypothetical protein AAFU85_25640 [Planctomycetota bacterium]